MLDEGVPAKSIMAALKLSRTTYFEWKKAYRERGSDGLKVRPLPGAAPKLTDRQSSQLRGWLAGRDPRQFQFDFALWTRKIVRDLIRQQFGVEMTPQGVGKLLHRLGLSPQRPLYRAYQQDPEAVRRWKEERFPAIRAQARRAMSLRLAWRSRSEAVDLEASGDADDAGSIFAGGEVAGLLGGPWAGPVGAVADEEARVEDLEQERGQGQVKILRGKSPP
jgi:transposase